LVASKLRQVQSISCK